MFPHAELFTSVYDPEPWPERSPTRPVHASFLNRMPGASRHYPKLLPLMNRAFRSFDLSRLRPRALQQPRVREERAQAAGRAARLLLPHADALRLGGGVPRRARTVPRGARWLLPPLLAHLRRQDLAGRSRRSMCSSPTRAYVAERIRRYYGRDAADRAPPRRRRALPAAIERRARGLLPRLRPRGALQAGRPRGRGVRRSGARLKVAGDGRALDAVRERRRAPRASSSWARCPTPSATRCWRAPARCCSPARRTSGSCRSRPRPRARRSIAYGVGGALETVQDGVTGVLFDEQDARGLRRRSSASRR